MIVTITWLAAIRVASRCIIGLKSGLLREEGKGYKFSHNSRQHRHHFPLEGTLAHNRPLARPIFPSLFSLRLNCASFLVHSSSTLLWHMTRWVGSGFRTELHQWSLFRRAHIFPTQFFVHIRSLASFEASSFAWPNGQWPNPPTAPALDAPLKYLFKFSGRGYFFSDSLSPAGPSLDDVQKAEGVWLKSSWLIQRDKVFRTSSKYGPYCQIVLVALPTPQLPRWRRRRRPSRWTTYFRGCHHISCRWAPLSRCSPRPRPLGCSRSHHWNGEWNY